MNRLRDKFGRFVSLKDVGKKELEIAIRLYNEPDPVQRQDALRDMREAGELVLILVATIAICVWIYLKVIGQ